jgi:hypothetical protein
MSVDYDAVGGIGLLVDDDMGDKFLKLGLFSKNDWHDDKESCLSELGFDGRVAGSFYSGDTWWYIFVNGGTLKQINENTENFINKLKTIGINKTEEDLKVICDICVC